MNDSSLHTSASPLSDPLPIPAVGPSVPATPDRDSSTAQRVEHALDALDQLTEAPARSEGYEVPELDFELPSRFKLSVVMPVYNEASTLHEILARVTALPLPMEIILVDDCSSDGTRELLASMAGIEGLRVIFHPRNMGKGAALRTGFTQASGDVIIVQDADLEYDPRDIPSLLKPILDGSADVVYGSRFLGDVQQDPSFLHRFGNRALTWASNLFNGLQLTDMETCYKVFRADVIRKLNIQQHRFGVEPEVTAKLARSGCRIVELPISYQARSYAQGKKIGLKDAINALYCIVRYRLAD